MSSTALLHFSSCMGSFCWPRAFTQPARSRNCTANSRPPSADDASAEWYVNTNRFLLHFTTQIFLIAWSWISNTASFCQFVFLTYILGVAWLGVFGFSAVPVFLFYNMWSTCATMRSPMVNLTNIDSICVDVRQYGVYSVSAVTSFMSSSFITSNHCTVF